MHYLQAPPGKYIDGLSADMAATEAAARILSIRLQAVEAMLPLARERAGDSPEFVHQLRVSTRRADAALRTLDACLEASVARKVRRRLRRIRRSAIAARECDVHLEHFRRQRDEGSRHERAVLDDLITWTLRQREDAQRAIDGIATKVPVAKLQSSRRKVLDAIGEPRGIAATDGDTVTLLDMARATVPPLVDDMRDGLAADLRVLDNLHDLRIRGKRLRYALEIFGVCFPGGLKRESAQIATLQKTLGTINDLAEIIRRIETFAVVHADETDPDRRATLDAVLERERERLAVARRQAVDGGESGAWTAGLDRLAAEIEGTTVATKEIAP